MFVYYNVTALGVASSRAHLHNRTAAESRCLPAQQNIDELN